jgi:integrase/recombinase XerD
MRNNLRLHQFAEKLDIAAYLPRTLETYCDGVKRFMRYLDEQESVKSIDDAQPEHITAYQAYLQFGTKEKTRFLAVTTQRQRLNSLRLFFEMIYAERDPRHEYGAKIVLPKTRQSLPRNVPAEEIVKTLLDSIDASTVIGLRDRTMLELLYATGVRSMELLTLTVDAVNLSDKTIFIHGKGAKDRIVPIGAWVMPWLIEWLEVGRPKLVPKRNATDLLFVTKTGRQIAHSNLSYTIRKYIERLGLSLRINPHAFRHACATHLLKHGADVRYIQELLGHANLSTTAIYTKVDITALKQAHGRFHPREKGNDV